MKHQKDCRRLDLAGSVGKESVNSERLPPRFVKNRTKKTRRNNGLITSAAILARFDNLPVAAFSVPGNTESAGELLPLIVHAYLRG
jgi:hypothetical protein